ncbi:hypothetical protein TNCV_3715551 [Trichonephila clavipes]|nr:hypothetical protein TNCV_3715551 [Trichonephila clavipes]
MSNGSCNDECPFVDHLTKRQQYLKMQLPTHFSVGRIIVCLVAIENKNTDVGLERKGFDLPVVSRKVKLVFEIRIEILVPHPKMHLVLTFGTPDPASSVLEGTGSTIVWHYPAKLLKFI